MNTSDLIKALKRLKVQTSSLSCLGCGHEHNCGVHGCAIIRAAVEALQNAVVFQEDRKPLVWGDKRHDTVLCPYCRHDLMGGFPEGDIETDIVQCPYCGEFVNSMETVDEAIETEQVEMCPDCGRENVYPNWTPEDGWRQKCQNCGEMILLCDACLHADDNSGRICDWDNITCKCFRDRR